jgi:hypothetical protein
MDTLVKIIGAGMVLFLAYALISTGLDEMFDDGIFGFVVCALVVGFGGMLAYSVFKND